MYSFLRRLLGQRISPLCFYPAGQIPLCLAGTYVLADVYSGPIPTSDGVITGLYKVGNYGTKVLKGPPPRPSSSEDPYTVRSGKQALTFTFNHES